MDDEEAGRRRDRIEAQKQRRLGVQSRLYDLLATGYQQAERVMKRFEDAGIEVPEELGDRLYEITASHLEYQGQLLEMMQRSANKLMDRHFKPGRAPTNCAEDEPSVLEHKRADGKLAVRLRVTNPTQLKKTLTIRKAEVEPKLAPGVLSEGKTAVTKLEPGGQATVVWILSPTDACPDVIRLTLRADVGSHGFSRSLEVILL